jgi:hypothetical protein
VGRTKGSIQRQPGWIARADREEVLLSGTAVLADGRTIPVEVTNLSKDGCSLRSDELIGIGEMVSLNVPPLKGVEGTIRWSLFGSAGVRFVSAWA